MKNDDKSNAFDRNLAKIFSSGRGQASPDFERRLLDAVGQQVRQQRRWRLQKRWFVGVSAAAAVLILAILIVPHNPLDSDDPIGLVTDIRGLVVLRNGERSEAIAGQRDIHARQWVQTQSGTTAQVVLTDQSTLTPQPRTAMQLDRQRHGHIVRLEKGAVAIEAHKQPPGQYLTVQTPGSAIKILGTRLDVRVVEKPTGIKQTRVYLHSGSVELTSAGASALLLPGMVGVAEEGQAPWGESDLLEVNELRRLLRDTRQRAAQTDAKANMPMILDYVGSTAWIVVPLNRFNAESGNIYSLQLKYPAYGVKAYTLEGATIETRAEGRLIHADFSSWADHAGKVGNIVLRIPNATGLVRVNSDRSGEFILPAATSPSVTLLQLCLPKWAKVRALTGEIVEVSERLGRQVVTLRAESEALQLYE
jgi:hypothetical protein